jgi:hypothetical protein
MPAHFPHGDTCLGDEPFVMLDTFYPVRQDSVAGGVRHSAREGGIAE